MNSAKTKPLSLAPWQLVLLEFLILHFQTATRSTVLKRGTWRPTLKSDEVQGSPVARKTTYARTPSVGWGGRVEGARGESYNPGLAPNAIKLHDFSFCLFLQFPLLPPSVYGA